MYNTLSSLIIQMTATHTPSHKNTCKTYFVSSKNVPNAEPVEGTDFQKSKHNNIYKYLEDRKLEALLRGKQKYSAYSTCSKV